MNEERLMILKMLEQGKISSEEATKLLDSLKNKESSYSRFSNNNESQSAEKTNFEALAKDVGKKLDIFARDFEPKFQKFTQSFAEKTVEVAERISKNISSSDMFNKSETTTAASTPTTLKDEGKFEVRVNESEVNELSLSSLNGDLLIKGYNGDKITLKVFYKAKNPTIEMDLLKLGNKFYLNYDEANFTNVSIDAVVPSSLFSSIQFNAINGKLSADNLKGTNISLFATNSEVTAKDIQSEKLRIESSSGKINLNNIISSDCEIEVYSGSIDAFNIDAKNMKLGALNGSINIITSDFKKFNEYLWSAEASNGTLKISLPSISKLGYYIKAHTSLSDISIGLTRLNYLCNEKTFVEAKSFDYDSLEKKVKLNLEASNAPLIIN